MTENVNEFEALPQAENETEKNEDTIPQEKEKIFVPIKYNKQIINLDIESAAELAQKGLKFESISKDFESLKQIANSKGKSVSEFISELQNDSFDSKKQQLLEKCGGDEAFAEHILELEKGALKDLRGFEELKEKFPKFKTLESLPESVVENARLKGSLLLDEYLRYKLEQEIAIKNSQLKQQQARMASAGSQLTKRGNDNPEAAEFLRGLWNK